MLRIVSDTGFSVRLPFSKLLSVYLSPKWTSRNQKTAHKVNPLSQGWMNSLGKFRYGLNGSKKLYLGIPIFALKHPLIITLSVKLVSVWKLWHQANEDRDTHGACGFREHNPSSSFDLRLFGSACVLRFASSCDDARDLTPSFPAFLSSWFSLSIHQHSFSQGGTNLVGCSLMAFMMYLPSLWCGLVSYLLYPVISVTWSLLWFPACVLGAMLYVGLLLSWELLAWPLPAPQVHWVWLWYSDPQEETPVSTAYIYTCQLSSLFCCFEMDSFYITLAVLELTL